MTIKKIGKNQYRRPSGVIASKDDKYFYWSCTVSNIATFANAERFKKVVEAAGSEKKLVKTFVCREAKKYLAKGWKPEAIAQLVIDHKGNLPKIEPKLPKLDKHPKMAGIAKKPRKKRLKAIGVETVVEVVNGEEVETVLKTYPWSADPENYFLSGDKGTIDYSKEINTCHRPDFYLDMQCHGCPLYNDCACKSKYEPDAHKNKKYQKAVKVTPLSSVPEDAKDFC